MSERPRLGVFARIGIGAGAIGCVLFVLLVALRVGGFYKPFYMPAESMAPTLLKGDRIIASMSGVPAVERGDVIVFATARGVDYVKRVAGLPGDRIALANGIVFVNGRPVAQHYVGTDTVAPGEYGNQARRLTEQFPGEAAPHEIYDLGVSMGDDFAEQRVAPGHLFVLGDNRDESADSRFAVAEQGVEQVPIDAVHGRVLFYYWSVERSRIGARVH